MSGIDRTNITELVDQGNGALAMAYLRVLIDSEPTLSNVQFGLRVVDKLSKKRQIELKPVRLSLLPTFTADLLIPYIRMLGALSGMDVSCTIGAFNQVHQEALSPRSVIYQSDPHVIVLALRSEEFLPELFAGYMEILEKDRVKEAVESALNSVNELISAIRMKSEAAIIVHNFLPPATPDLGLVDAQQSTGQNAAFYRLNQRLSDIVSQLGGVFVLDYARVVSRLGSENWHDRRMWHLARMPLSSNALPILAEEYTAYLRPLSGLNRKCLVLDLDNTLWGGIVGEDGIDGIKIGQDYPGNAFLGFQMAIRRLYDRGIILAINSKNNELDVFEVFDTHPDMVLRRENFAAMRINWNDKAANMRSLADELNIGLDQMVFFDDSPVERDLVRCQIPQVLIPEVPEDPVEYAHTLENIRDFDSLTWSVEDRNRTKMYRAESSRRVIRDSASSLEDFWTGLDMEVIIGCADSLSIPRISQLTQRTNQFNLTTRRYSEADIAQAASSDDSRVYHMRLKDRFGDSGIVGVGIIRVEDECWNINSFLMSCRVLGRTAEDAFLAFIADEARESGAKFLTGLYIPTKKNVQVASLYPGLGFNPVESTEDKVSKWKLNLLEKSLTVPRWIKLQASETVSS